MFIDPVTLFREGGPFMLAILAVASVLQVAVVVLMGTLLARLRVPVVIWVALALLPLLLGLFGTFQGAGLALSAIANASPDMVPTLGAAGLSVSFYTLIGGAYASAATFVVYAIGTGLALLMRPGKISRFTTANAVIAVLVLLVGSLAGMLLSGPAAALVLFGTGVGMSLAGLRFPEEEERDQRRVAAGRAATVLYGVLALGCVSIGSATLAYSLRYQAEAHASADAKSMIMARAMEGFGLSQWGLLGLAAFLLVSTPFLIGPGMKVLDRRAWITAVLASMCVLPVLGMAGITGWRVLQLVDIARPTEQVRTEALSALGVTLPDGDPAIVLEPLLRGTSVTFTRSGVRLDGEAAQPSELSGVADRVIFEAPGTVPLNELKPWAAEAGADAICVAVRTPQIRCIDVRARAQLPETPPLAEGERAIEERVPPTRVKWTEDGWSVHFSDPVSGDTVREDELELRDLKLALRDIRDRFQEPAAQVWFGGEARVADFVAFYEAVSEVQPADYGGPEIVPHLVWRLDAAESFPEKVIEEDDLPSDPKEAFAAAGKKTVRRYANQIRYCYERELAKRPDLSGQIEIQVSIGPDGRVINARVARSTLANAQVEQCVVSRFLRMEFMAPPSGGVEVLRLPYSFGTE